MTTYERVTYRLDGETKSRTIILQNVVETSIVGHPAITGVEVDREGVEVAPRGVDERVHILQVSLITRRTPLYMNSHYGWLQDEPWKVPA